MGKTILIVDDSATIRQVVGMTLKGAGYEVMEASDGKDALNKIDGKKINLIISDVNMPNMDGITLIARLRALPQYKFTPLIMLTTESQEDKKVAGKKAGATGWVVKPFDPARLVAVAKMVCPA